MKRIVIIVFLMGVFLSCEDRLGELNTPTKNAVSVPADQLFANGVRNMFDLMASTDVNSNVFRLYSQYWAQTTYPDESQYNMVGRQIPDNFWTFAYRDVLMDLEQAEVNLEANWESMGMDEAVKNNQDALITINQVYMYSILVDAFGAIPFDESLREDIVTPKYEPGQDVYNKIIDSLDVAISSMDPAAEGFSSNQDIVYQGDVSKWLKFANSLKLRLAVNISDVDPGKATSMITEAMASGVFTSNEDNASVSYLATPPNTNPVWEDLVQSGRADYVVANTLVDQLQALNDPRLGIYADPMEDGTFVGGEYGTANTYSDNSHVGELFHQPDLEGTIMDYAQVNFLLAEAAAKGLIADGDAATYYNEGIRASMMYWGIEDEGAIEDYIAQPEVAYSDADWKQKIGIQSWIASYNNAFEGWTTWRRLDFEGFNVPEGLTEADIPRRLIFPIEEATLNPTAWREAVEMIDGDNVQNRIFWDVE